MAELVPLGRRVGISGGGARIVACSGRRRRWTGDFEYVFQDQSSLLGAAMLGVMHLDRVESVRPLAANASASAPERMR